MTQKKAINRVLMHRPLCVGLAYCGSLELGRKTGARLEHGVGLEKDMLEWLSDGRHQQRMAASWRSCGGRGCCFGMGQPCRRSVAVPATQFDPAGDSNDSTGDSNSCGHSFLQPWYSCAAMHSQSLWPIPVVGIPAVLGILAMTS